MICDIRMLVGAEEASAVQTAYARISLEDLGRGDYEVYFRMEDPATGESIQMANEQEEREYGYYIGKIGLHYRNSLSDKWGKRGG